MLIIGQPWRLRKQLANGPILRIKAAKFITDQNTFKKLLFILFQGMRIEKRFKGQFHKISNMLSVLKYEIRLFINERTNQIKPQGIHGWPQNARLRRHLIA